MIRRVLAIALLVCICAVAVLAGTTVPTNCGTGADVVIAGGKAWGTPANACIGVSTTAVAIPASAVTDFLATTNYGFSIPGPSTVLGVQVSFRRSANTATDIFDNTVVLTKNGTVAVGLDHGQGGFWPNSPGAVANYGATNDTWSAGLAPADVNAATFGVLISALNSNGTNARSATIYDSVTISVTYSSPATGFSPGIIGTITRSAGSVRIF